MNDEPMLPPWTAVQATEPPPRNPVLIDGVVRVGHVMLLAGKGKIGKSWAAIELCVAIAAGRESWLGLPLRASGSCLFIDPELDAKSLDHRFRTVAEAMGVDAEKVDSKVARWSLRGVPNATMNAIVHDLERRPGEFVLVVIDSASVFIEGDENSSTDIRRFSNKVLRVSEVTGATVLLVHHYGKAVDGDRAASDRARGSSVWLDFPDAMLTITEVLPPSGDASDVLPEGHYACVLEAGGIREFPRMEPIHVIFGYPLHRVDLAGITDDWKPRSSQRKGGKSTAEIKKATAEARHLGIAAKLLAHFYANGIVEGMPIADAARLCGCDARTLTNALDGKYLKVEQKTQRKRLVVPTSPPPPQLPLGD